MNRRASTRVALAGIAAMVLTACAGGGDSSDRAVRRVAIEMRDNSFSPATISVTKGERVRFIFTNRGAVPHDAFVGTEQEQAEHEEEMRAEVGHGGHDDDGVTVQPGESAEQVVTFDESGTQLIGCHEPGHYAAGMRAVITVE